MKDLGHVWHFEELFGFLIEKHEDIFRKLPASVIDTVLTSFPPAAEYFLLRIICPWCLQTEQNMQPSCLFPPGSIITPRLLGSERIRKMIDQIQKWINPNLSAETRSSLAKALWESY